MRKARADSVWAVNIPASQPASAWVSTDELPAESTPVKTLSDELTEAATSAARIWTGATTTTTIRASVGRCRRQILMATSMISPTERGRRSGTSTAVSVTRPAGDRPGARPIPAFVFPDMAEKERRFAGWMPDAATGVRFPGSCGKRTPVGRRSKTVVERAGRGLQRLDQGGVAL